MRKSRERIEQEYREALVHGDIEDIERVMRSMYNEGSDYSAFLAEVHAEAGEQLTLREIDEQLEDDSLRGMIGTVMGED